MYIAQLNIARAIAPLDSPQLKDFMDNLAPINEIAESSSGFVWRLKDDTGNATDIQAFEDPLMIVNMSVWENVEALKHFMFKTHHLDLLKRKQEWFVKTEQANYVLWWIEKGHLPTLEEAKQRLFYLRENGESPYAFSFRSRYSPGDTLG